MAVALDNYAPATPSAWCPGCGNFGILKAVNSALVALNLAPHQVLLVSGIGQAGKLPHYTRGHVLNELHGRPVPAAQAAKIVSPELTVIAVSGDGDGYGEGGNHFIHAMNRNVDMTYLVHNNQVYALTKGQAGPTSDLGYTTKTTPDGAWAPLRPLALAVACDCSFVARGFAGDPEHLSKLIQMGIKHPGFSLIEILQPCVTFNRKNTFQWYKQRVYKLEEEKTYDPADRAAAFSKAVEWGERIPIGLVYKNDRPTFDKYLGTTGKTPLVKQKLEPVQVEPLLDEFM